MNRAHHGGFTLVEMLISVSVSTIVITGIVLLFVQLWGGWCNALADWQLMTQSRLVREKMLHGIAGQYGLREAQLSTLAISTNGSNNSVVFNDLGTNVTIQLSSSNSLTAGAASIINILPSAVYINAIKMSLTTSTVCQTFSILTMNVTMQTTVAGKTYIYPQNLNTYLINQ